MILLTDSTDPRQFSRISGSQSVVALTDDVPSDTSQQDVGANEIAKPASSTGRPDEEPPPTQELPHADVDAPPMVPRLPPNSHAWLMLIGKTPSQGWRTSCCLSGQNYFPPLVETRRSRV